VISGGNSSTVAAVLTSMVTAKEKGCLRTTEASQKQSLSSGLECVVAWIPVCAVGSERQSSIRREQTAKSAHMPRNIAKATALSWNRRLTYQFVPLGSVTHRKSAGQNRNFSAICTRRGGCALIT
jgi:hypothetical protein